MAKFVLSHYEASSGKNKKSIIQGARYYIDHFSTAKQGVHCKTTQETKQHIRLILQLNIPSKQIIVMRVQSRKSKFSLAEEQKQVAHKIGLPESSVSVFDAGASKTYLNGYYRVQILNAKANKSGILRASTGFRFAMYMIKIMEGLDN